MLLPCYCCKYAALLSFLRIITGFLAPAALKEEVLPVNAANANYKVRIHLWVSFRVLACLSSLWGWHEAQAQIQVATTSFPRVCPYYEHRGKHPSFPDWSISSSCRCYSTVESLRVSQGREWHPLSTGEHINNPAGWLTGMKIKQEDQWRRGN